MVLILIPVDSEHHAGHVGLYKNFTIRGGESPPGRNREIFFKKIIGRTRKDAITWLVIKLQQRFWYQYNRETEPDTVVYVTSS